MNDLEIQSWRALHHIYSTLASDESREIITQLLRHDKLQLTVLKNKSKIPEPTLYVVLKKLTTCCLLEKEVQQDRTTYYSISPFGKHVIKLSEPLLLEVKRVFKQDSLARK